jgi:formylglycine-generating enzyme required for sulfatase activity
LAGLVLGAQAQLVTYNFGSFSMDFVTIGNAGNAAHPAEDYGAVPYRFQMGKLEVSRFMIAEAKAAAGLGISLYDMTGYGGNGPSRPATGISWYEAARFVNWLNTSTGHQPAYQFDATGTFALWDPAEAWSLGGENRYRHKDAFFFLPSENEWYKAAYFDPAKSGGPGYWLYPTGSDLPPAEIAAGTATGSAVYNQPPDQGPADVDQAGGLSPYGTMGQGGNVLEWMESALDGGNDTPGENRVLRSGYWTSAAPVLQSLNRGNISPANEAHNFGFRVAAVPEPADYALLTGLALAGFALGRSRLSSRRSR